MRPEIPGNTGNIGRLAVGLGARLHLIHPLGFRTDEKAVRRAGIDHWKHVDVQEHVDAEAFWAWSDGRRVHRFSAHGEQPFTQASFSDGDVLLFGPESVGLPSTLRSGSYHIPMVGEIRSLNLSNAVAVVCYEWARTVHAERF